MLYRDLKPSWINPIPKQQEMEIWKIIRQHLTSFDPEIHSRFMFGDEQKGIPWCTGYLIGSNIIGKFLENNPQKTFMDLINMESEEILSKSGYENYILSKK
jgi:uncharacterized protein YjaZ